jgi:hypothetical protein
MKDGIQQTRELIQSVTPHLLKKYGPRRYSTPTGYVSTEWAATHMAANELSFKGVTADLDNGIAMKAHAIHLEWHKLNGPTYFVSENLLKAALNNSLPKIPCKAIRWPLDAIMFMLPTGVLTNPEGASINFLVVAKHFGSMGCTTGVDQGKGIEGIAQYASIRDFNPDAYVCDEVKDPAGFSHFTGDTLNLNFYTGDHPEIEFIDRLRVLAINLLLIMSARPELVETTSSLVTSDNKKVGKVSSREDRQRWSPNWIGRDFRIKTDTRAKTTTVGAKRPSPEMHWRRGHYREQPYGEKLSKKKTIWMEPVLIGGKDDDQVLGSRAQV